MNNAEDRVTDEGETKVSFVLNGAPVTIHVPPTQSLVSILRDQLGLTGTKVGCSIGRCGACTVLLDGQPVNGCLVMAYQVEGRSILTIEGLSQDGGPQQSEGLPHSDTSAGEPPPGTEASALHPLQQAFLDAGGFQCGYCTPGMILATKALLDEYPNPTPAQIREALAGNLCRCTGYAGILRAIELADKRLEGSQEQTSMQTTGSSDTQ